MKFILSLFLVLCSSTLFSQTSVPIATSNYICFEDQTNSYLLRITRNNSTISVGFTTPIRRKRNRLNRLKDNKAYLISINASSSRLNSNQNKINRTKAIYQGLRQCKRGTFILNNPQIIPPASASCSIAADSTNPLAPIITGADCNPGDGPVALLEMTYPNGSTSSCSASFVSPDTLTTAAHCLDGTSLVKVHTSFGVYTANFVTYNPNYNFGFKTEFDFGLVKIPVATINQNFPILATNDITPGELSIVSGYGLDQNGNSGTLRAGYMFIYEADTDHIWSFFTGNGSNTCNGDSGGPILVQRAGVWTQAGVVSAGTLANCGAGDVSSFSPTYNPSNQAMINVYVP